MAKWVQIPTPEEEFYSPDFPEEEMSVESIPDRESLVESLNVYGGKRVKASGGTEDERRKKITDIQKTLVGCSLITKILKKDESSTTLGIIL